MTTLNTRPPLQLCCFFKAWPIKDLSVKIESQTSTPMSAPHGGLFLVYISNTLFS